MGYQLKGQTSDLICHFLVCFSCEDFQWGLKIDEDVLDRIENVTFNDGHVTHCFRTIVGPLLYSAYGTCMH